MKIYLIWPICLPVGYLLMAIVNYYVGFAVLPEVSLYVSLLFSICALMLLGGYLIGLRHPSLRSAEIIPTERALQRIVFWGSLSVLVGYLLLIANRLVLGINISTVLEETNQVRDMAHGSILTKVSVLMHFVWFPTLGSMTYMLSCKMKIARINWLLLAIIGMLLVFNSFLSVNRNPIIGFVLTLSFVYLVGMRVRLDRKFFGRMIKASILALIFLFLFGIYGRFIVNNRQKASISHLEISAVQSSRYELSAQVFTDGDVRLLHTLSYYFSHQFPYVDAAITIKGPLRFNPTVLNPWLVSQMSGIFPNLYYFYMQGPLAVNYKSGIPDYTWNSIVGMFVAGFGWLPPPFIFFFIGLFQGRSIGNFARRPSYISLLWAFLFYQCLSKPYMGFDFNMYCNGLFGFIILLIVLHKLGGLKSFTSSNPSRLAKAKH
tara:strand:+ start:6876 stop:8171 length:1296 start_codon:yes stop_codon:yes gene_type:complete